MKAALQAYHTQWEGIKSQLRSLLFIHGEFPFFHSFKQNWDYTSHSEHLGRNGVHKWYVFENISLHWLITNYFFSKKENL